MQVVETPRTTTSLPALEVLKQGQRWVCHNKEKAPINPHTGKGADCSDSATWARYEQAVSIKESGKYFYVTGIGREFVAEDGLTGIDLDNCRDESGNLSNFARAIIDSLHSYTEISPSGRGVHIWVYGNIPDNINADKEADGDTCIEMYDHSRYFTITGSHLPGTPTTIENRQRELLAIHKATTLRRATAKRQQQQTNTPRPDSLQSSARGDTPYGLKALEDECSILRNTPEGSRDNQMNKSAYAMGQLVGGHELTRATVENAIYDAAAATGLPERQLQKIPRIIEEGMQNPRSAPETEKPRNTRNVTQASVSSDKPIESQAQEQEQGEQKEKETTLTRLRVIAEEAEYIRTASGAFFARVRVNGHHEVVSINEKGSGFRRWLVFEYTQRHDGAIPNSEAMTLIMSLVLARAEYAGKLAKVYTRIAYHQGCIYLDLCNDAWECVKISPDGWHVTKEPPVYFRRTTGMLPLPLPTNGGDLDDLRKLIQAETENDYKLIVAWLVGALHPQGPYPVLNLNGLRGSRKTYTTKVLRNLLDPHEAPTRSAPKDDQAAAIMAQNNMIVALDNLSSLPLALSDVLCRIATGSGYSTRTLYENSQETIFNSCRPIIINGIEDGLISQGDLLNRAILVTLSPPITYRTEGQMNALFDALHPRILGALLDTVAYALKHRESTYIEKLPRMADFAQWITAAEPALHWQRGAFMEAFTNNQDNASSIIVEASPAAAAIVQLLKNNGKWESSTQALWDELDKYEVFSNAKTAPKNARSLSGHLKRIAPSLRVQGIEIQQPPRDKNGSRVIITYIASNIAGVANGVAKPADVANSVANVILLHQTESSLQAISSHDGVANDAGVAKCSTLSTILKTQEKEEREEGKPDKEEKFATSPTFATSLPENITDKLQAIKKHYAQASLIFLNGKPLSCITYFATIEQWLADPSMRDQAIAHINQKAEGLVAA